MKVSMIPLVVGALGTILKGLVKRLKDLEIRDHPDYNITEISQNTEKNPGDLRRLAVTQISVKNH